MRRAVKSGHFWTCIAFFVVFCITAAIVENRVILLLTNSLLLAVATAVGIAYIPVAWEAIRDQSNPEIQHIALGISLGWAFSAAWRIWSLFWLMTGAGPDYAFLVQNDVVAMFQAGISLGAFYHLTSPGALGHGKPRVKWIAIGGVIGAAFGIAAVLTYYTPNDGAKWLAKTIEPYVPR
jgi:hypothetical protein